MKAILDLGFVCIENRARSLILGLKTSIIRRATVAGVFYFIAQRNAKRIIIYSDCAVDFAHCIVLYNINDAYELLEEMAASATTKIRSMTDDLAINKKNRIRYIRVRSSKVRHLRIGDEALLPG